MSKAAKTKRGAKVVVYAGLYGANRIEGTVLCTRVKKNGPWIDVRVGTSAHGYIFSARPARVELRG